jgi:hypothetical protein
MISLGNLVRFELSRLIEKPLDWIDWVVSPLPPGSIVDCPMTLEIEFMWQPEREDQFSETNLLHLHSVLMDEIQKNHPRKLSDRDLSIWSKPIPEGGVHIIF